MEPLSDSLRWEFPGDRVLRMDPVEAWFAKAVAAPLLLVFALGC